jgi:hypothetical protein
MTIKATELLKLFTKAEKLNLSVVVREHPDGDYVIRIFEMFSPKDFDKKAIITQQGESNWNKGEYSFDAMMDILDEMLEEKEQEKIKAEKRKELIARLTDEEKELLGLGVSSQSVPHKSQMPF